jgi:hypothetical protein
MLAQRPQDRQLKAISHHHSGQHNMKTERESHTQKVSQKVLVKNEKKKKRRQDRRDVITLFDLT